MSIDTNQTQVKLEDLDLDIQFYIWENLQLNDLISLAETNERFSMLAGDIFRRKHSKKTLEIDFMDFAEESIIVSDKIISMNDSEIILKLLKKFGHFMKKLAIKPSDVNQTDIIQAINLFCADTLIEIDIHNFQSNFFEHMTKPFTQLKGLSLQGIFKRLMSPTLNLAELFPAMQNLTFEFVIVEDPNCSSDIAKAFPNLQHLSVNAHQFSNPNHINEDDFTELIKKNPQIRTLTLQNCDRNLLKVVNEIHPNLEVLELFDYVKLRNSEHDEGRIVFKNLKKFVITNSYESVPQNIDFKNLVEFHSDGSQAIGAVMCTKWIDIVEHNIHLERLHVTRDPLSNEQLEKLASISSKLTEIFLNVKANINNEAIVKLMRNSPKLKRMNLSVNFDHERNFEVAAGMIENEFGKKCSVTASECNLFVECSISV